MDNIGKDCRVKIPTAAYEFMRQENARRKTQDVRLMPITLIVEAILAAGLRAGGWEEIALEKAAAFKPLGKRARQPKKKK